jgi:hypothetical protein
VANKPGGLNVRNSDDLATPAARSLFAGRFGKPTHRRELGKADEVRGSNRQMQPYHPTGSMAQASWERLAEITSGRTSFQQGLAATCQDLWK